MTRKRRRRGGRGRGGRRRGGGADEAPQAVSGDEGGRADATSEPAAEPRKESGADEAAAKKRSGGGRRRRRGRRGGRGKGGKATEEGRDGTGDAASSGKATGTAKGKDSGKDSGKGKASDKGAGSGRGKDSGKGKGSAKDSGKDSGKGKASDKGSGSGRGKQSGDGSDSGKAPGKGSGKGSGSRKGPGSGKGDGRSGGNSSKAASKVPRDTEAWAIKRFERRPRPMGIPDVIEPPPRRIDIEWPTAPVPLSVQKEVGGLITRRGEFGYLPESRVQEIAKRIEDHPIDLDQALSLRGALNQEKSVFGHHRLMRRSNQLRRRYEDGVGILALAKDADAPPVNVFRAILTARGWSKNRIKESLKDPKRLDQRDRDQFRIAEDADRVSNVDQSETHQAADVFEEVLCDHFDRLGVRFRKQEDLAREQMRSEGRPIRTPDLLLLDDVRVDGVPVAWLDAKHFFGAALSFPRKKTQKQIDRYTEDYGHGAIVYRHGFCDGLRLKGAVLLDSSPLDLARLRAHHESRNGK